MATTQNSSLGLGGLPIETVRQIMEMLTRKELKALRLMSRKLCSVASERMYESITLSTTDVSFTQLLNLASSDFWREQVRHVEWILPTERVHATRFAQRIFLKDIESFGPWVKNLQPSTIITTGEEVSHIGLDLQCQAMRRMPNVKSVRFRCALRCAREGREPWQKRAIRSEQVQSSRFAVNAHDWGTKGTDIRHEPITVTAEDVFSILRHSFLTPSLLETATIMMFLGYSPKAELEDVNILAVPENFARHRFLGEETPPGASMGDRVELTDWQEEKYHLSLKNCFRSLVRNGVRTLKTFELSGASMLGTDLGDLLFATGELRDLQVSGSEVSVHPPDTEPVPALLLRLRYLYRQGRLKNLHVIFQDIGTCGSQGSFSATNEQVREWMEGGSDELIAAARAAFTPIEETGMGDEDGDEEEEEHELDARFTYGSDPGDDYQYDTEEETIDMICRQAIDDYCAEMDAMAPGP